MAEPSPTREQAEATFMRRCRVCGLEIETPWGPGTHRLSANALREHIEHHSLTELLRYAQREHFGSHP